VNFDRKAWCGNTMQTRKRVRHPRAEREQGRGDELVLLEKHCEEIQADATA